MPQSESEKIQALELELGLLKRDISVFDKYFAKIDITLEKMGEVSSQIYRLVSLHDERIETHQQETTMIKDLVEKRRQETILDLKNLEKKIAESEENLVKALDEHKKELLAELKTSEAGQEKRLKTLETWRYLLIGGAIVVFFFLGRWADSFISHQINPQETTIQVVPDSIPKR